MIVYLDALMIKMQSCLMQDEPEEEACFSRKMSLKEQDSGMLGVDHQHGERRDS